MTLAFGRTGASAYVPYFVFAAFAAFAGAQDVRVLRRGALAGADRIARHLWRMLTALFFASAFFFLGQQKVMPDWLKGSPILAVPALAPLAAMVVWLVRIWATRRLAAGAGRLADRLLAAVVFGPGRSPVCGS
ncbi:MAG: hypothetical protein JOZ27_05425 [Caulobacteraceae bacterium]|nr:hypothetical protein [Caulobacteraceae bacterium]